MDRGTSSNRMPCRGIQVGAQPSKGLLSRKACSGHVPPQAQSLELEVIRGHQEVARAARSCLSPAGGSRPGGEGLEEGRAIGGTSEDSRCAHQGAGSDLRRSRRLGVRPLQPLLAHHDPRGGAEYSGRTKRKSRTEEATHERLGPSACRVNEWLVQTGKTLHPGGENAKQLVGCLESEVQLIDTHWLCMCDAVSCRPDKSALFSEEAFKGGARGSRAEVRRPATSVHRPG